MINRYGRGLLIAFIFFVSSHFAYMILRDIPLSPSISPQQKQQNDIAINSFILFMSGAMAEFSIGFIRLDILDSMNKRSIRHSDKKL